MAPTVSGSQPRTRGLCVVTGASRGIGRAVAHRMAAEGHAVLATGRDEAALEETVSTAPAPVTAARLDVTDPEAVAELLGGREVDVLINNAGVASSAPVHRVTLDQWNETMATNVTAVFVATKAVLTGMRERDRGRIVTVASVASHVGTPYTAAYSASKHAALGFMRVVAAEVAGTGITANAVCPAYVDTPMTDATVDNIEARTGIDSEEARRRLMAMVPLGRLIEPAEVAHVVAFLAHPDSGAINGQSIVMDGGGVQR